MNICICTDGYPSKGLPYSAFIQVLAHEMTRKGCKIVVIAPQSITKYLLRGGKLAPCYFEDQVDVSGDMRIIKVYRPITFTFGEGLLGKWTARFNKWATEFTFKRNRMKPDLFYSHFWVNGFNAERIAHKEGKPLFIATGEDKITIHNYISAGDISRLKYGVSGVICVSTKNKKESIQQGLATADKCVVLPNAYDPKEFYPIDKMEARKSLGFPPDAFIVGFCGRFNQRKGAMRVAEALAQLNDPRIKSIFIGSVADNETAQPDCEGILFKGTLPHAEIVRYLNCADVFVLPSLAEGCPNSVIEAMACGLPIISSDLPFNYDILDSSNSMLVSPMSVQEIADAIVKLKNDEPLRQNLREGALKKASELTIEKRVTKILDFIRERCRQVE
ncbi:MULTISPECIES: glycosyltransferase [unclassified Prevotella]|uniref:glycosyltransferase n=1 Tax=unclassified Prevotella TaxID=2638335 RepID=UPI00048C3CA1|nr:MULTISPECIES: glycosyltransferase [unclassified Prevotella]